MAGRGTFLWTLCVCLSALASGAFAEATALVFKPSGAEHYQGLTKTVVGEAACGDDFRIVLAGDKKVDTAWRIESSRLDVPEGAVAVVVDFDIYADADWRPVSWDGPNRTSRFRWYGRDGKSLKAPPWMDQLGIPHEAERFDLQFKPGVYSHFRLVRDVPDGASSFALVFGRDTPNVGVGERVSVRGVRASFVARGGERPDEQIPDMDGPEVVMAFESPTEDCRVPVRYLVRDPAGVDWESLSVSDMSGKERYDCERADDAVVIRPGFAWPRGDHHFRIVVRDLLGNETKEAKAFRIGEKPRVPGTTLRRDGVLLCGGTPVFPIGFFALCPREANLYSLERCFADVRAAGVNLAHSYSHFKSAAFAAGCARQGMISFQREYESAEGSAWFEKTARQDPTVGLWYVGDDTCMHFRPSEIANRVETLRALDGTRLTCHADVYTGRFADYADLVDVFMPEIYPIHSDADATNCVAATIDVMEKSLADIRVRSRGRPHAVWPIIQHFKGFSSWKRMPTPQEVYAMSFASIIHGAKGITWYTYGGFIIPEKKKFNYGVCSSAETWNAATNLTRRISELSPVLLSPDIAPARAPEILSGPAVDGCGRPSVTVLQKSYEGRRYLLAVNATSERVRVRLSLGCAGKASVLYENRRLETDGGAFADAFGPFAVHIYEADGGNE